MKFAQKRFMRQTWLWRLEKVREHEMALSHGELMVLLDSLYGASTDAEKSKIRSRFKSLQKVELPSGARPGRGTRAKYDHLQVAETTLVFELAQLGIDSAAVKAIFQAKLIELAIVLSSIVRKNDPAYPKTILIFTLHNITSRKKFEIDLLRLVQDSDNRLLADFMEGRRVACLLNFDSIAHDMRRNLHDIVRLRGNAATMQS